MVASRLVAQRRAAAGGAGRRPVPATVPPALSVTVTVNHGVVPDASDTQLQSQSHWPGSTSALVTVTTVRVIVTDGDTGYARRGPGH